MGGLPWICNYQGYGLTTGHKSKALDKVTARLASVLRGWIRYFRLTEVEEGTGIVGSVEIKKIALPAMAAVEKVVYTNKDAY
ncbi:group II intron maturase-specific domain-containing protein [Yersinia pseudotuberculosis]|uniref:group II intron maturase-specific domain-containing protein n=1 Tax=Yersinia pseudotuberculosis TaxID=633 RepID=UPI0009BB6493|nr:group II intron maturase-specific domain-containing protein [Yersinia pseudotuberculosis]